ncbi:hypothetical protein ACFFJN_06785 [Erwinia mallotivora]
MIDSVDCFVIRKKEEGINYGFLVRDNDRWYYENSNLRPWKKGCLKWQSFYIVR